MNINKTRQINNLTIKYSKLYEKWHVISPDGVVLEAFGDSEDAVKFAEETFDFAKKILGYI